MNSDDIERIEKQTLYQNLKEWLWKWIVDKDVIKLNQQITTIEELENAIISFYDKGNVVINLELNEYEEGVEVKPEYKNQKLYQLKEYLLTIDVIGKNNLQSIFDNLDLKIKNSFSRKGRLQDEDDFLNTAKIGFIDKIGTGNDYFTIGTQTYKSINFRCIINAVITTQANKKFSSIQDVNIFTNIKYD